MSLDSYLRLASRLTGEYAHAVATVKDQKRKLKTARTRAEAAVTAQQMLQDVAQAVQQQAHDRIAGVVTKCLAAVFGVKDEILIKKDRLPNPVIPGVSEVPGRKGWVILAVHKSPRMDKKKSQQSRHGGFIQKRSSEDFQDGETDSSGIRRSTSEKKLGGLSSPRPGRYEQRAGESGVGTPHRKHETSKNSRTMEGSQNQSGDRRQNKKKVQNRKVHHAKPSRQVQVGDMSHTPDHPPKGMVRVSIKKEAYSFHIVFYKRRGKTEVEFEFRRRKLVLKPEDGVGGSVLDVSAFALRLACLGLKRPAPRKAVFVDEGFGGVSARQGNKERVRQLLEVLADELGFQFVVITHDQDLEIGKPVEITS